MLTALTVYRQVEKGWGVDGFVYRQVEKGWGVDSFDCVQTG